MKTPLLSRLAFLSVVLLPVATLAPAQMRDYGTDHSKDRANPHSTVSEHASAFKTVIGTVVRADAEEKILYLSESKTEKKVKVNLSPKTKIRVKKQKGGLDLVSSLKAGMTVKVTVNSETGVAVSVRALAPKKG
ncbi:MAG: hypothetical protein ACE5HD_03680 [Acidobacteriota bacterium]